jgi:MFS family permease
MSTAIVPVGISLLRDLVSRERATLGIALMSGTLGIGSALGLPLSGVLSTFGGLPALFWFSAIASAVFTVLVLAFVGESPVRAPGRFDLVGTLALSIALTCLLLLISKSLAWMDAAPWAVPLLVAVGFVAASVWVVVALGYPTPVIDLRTSLRRRVLLTNTATFFVAFGMFANHLLTMQEARAPVASGMGLGLAPLGAGLVLVPAALAMVLLAPVAGRLLNRAGGRIALALGTAIICGAYVFRVAVHDGLFIVVASATLVGIGTSFAFAAMPMLIIDAVPANETASATAVNSLVRSLSGATASAIFAYLVVAYPSAIGAEFPSETGLTIALGLVALLSAAGTLTALALPRAGR